MTDGVALPGSGVGNTRAPSPSRAARAAGALRRRLRDAAAGSTLLDAILRRRASDICAKTGLLDQIVPHGLCIDIGSGLGHLAERIVGRHPVVTVLGIDPTWVPTPAVAARLDQSARGRIRFCRADGRALPVGDRVATTALVAFVLHHLPPGDQDAVLAEAARVLRPGGTLILLEDTPASDTERRLVEAADRRLNLESRGEPHAYRRPDEWHACLRRNGFDVAHSIPFTRIFPPAALRPVPHHAFVCAAAAKPGQMSGWEKISLARP